jgi:hypothetical protein
MRQALVGPFLAAAALAAALAGCSASSIIDRLPADVGEPAGTPARPAETYQYPAVHDMPPPRPDTPLSDAQQVKVEHELERARDRLEGQAPAKPDKKAAPKAKTVTKPKTETEPAPANEAAGGNANP